MTPLSQWFSFRCDTLVDRIKTKIYEGEITEAAKVLETFTCGQAGHPPSTVEEVRTEVDSCGVVYPLDNDLLHIKSEASPVAEELHLPEEGLHLFGGVGDEAEVVGVPQYEFTAPIIVGEADPLGGLQEADKGAYH